MTSIRAFIVEDNLEIARVHREFVSAAAGFVVVGEAHTGRAALDEIMQLQPDVVLLDIYLPDMTGLDVLRQLRASDVEGMDVIAVTAARDLDSVRAAGAMGVRHYLVKPFPLSALGERLAEMRRYRQHVRNASDSSVLDQRGVDQLLGGAKLPLGSSAMPKGLTSTTLALVAQALLGADGDSSAAEVADRVGMSRVSARRYLEFLVLSGKADVVPRYGGIGRPENRYRVSGSPAR